MRYVLVHELSGPAADYHRGLVEEIAERFNERAVVNDNLPSHLTLKYWFEASDSEREELLEYLRSFAASHSPAALRIAGSGAFGRHTVYLDIEPSPGMRRSFGELIDGLRQFSWLTWNRFDGPDLHFHASVAMSCHEHFDAIQRFVDARVRSFDASFDNLTLIGRSTPPEAEIGDAQIVEKCRLSDP